MAKVHLKLVEILADREIYERPVKGDDEPHTVVLRRFRGGQCKWLRMKDDNTYQIINHLPVVRQLYQEREATLNGTPRPCE